MMKRLLLATTALAVAAIASQASAADLPARMYTKAAPIAPITNWTGLYIGGNVGGGFGTGNTDFAIAGLGGVPATLNNKPGGVLGGGQIGYNWQLGTTLFGLEADIQGTGIKGDGGPVTAILANTGAVIPGSALTSSESLPWFGTVRARLGVLATPSLLLYATGGLAYGSVETTANTFFSAGNQTPASFSDTKTGWTAGAGLEWMFTRGWSAKVEYLYVDLGSTSATATSTLGIPATYTSHLQENTVRFGVNYHFN
jgi:outer membrane immunogenic protein